MLCPTEEEVFHTPALPRPQQNRSHTDTRLLTFHQLAAALAVKL